MESVLGTYMIQHQYCFVRYVIFYELCCASDPSICNVTPPHVLCGFLFFSTVFLDPSFQLLASIIVYFLSALTYCFFALLNTAVFFVY